MLWVKMNNLHPHNKKKKEGKKMLKYFFYIIDREFDKEYSYVGYFDNHQEAGRFIDENEAVGNTVKILSPYWCIVDPEEAGF